MDEKVEPSLELSFPPKATELTQTLSQIFWF